MTQKTPLPVPAPLPFVVNSMPRVVAACAGRRVLDLACGSGRHARLCLDRGLSVLAVDRDVSRLQDLEGRPGFTGLEFDLEGDRPWPFADEDFGAVIVANYLHRPTLPLACSLAGPGGVLVYETFGIGQERFGRPANPAFLVKPGELAAAAREAGLDVAIEFFETREGALPSVRSGVLAERPVGK